MTFSLRCHMCHAEYPASALFVCTACMGPLEVTWDYDKVAQTLTRLQTPGTCENPIRHRHDKDVRVISLGDVLDTGKLLSHL